MDKPKLFLASCVSLVTTAMVFAIRGEIATAMAGAFHLTIVTLGALRVSGLSGTGAGVGTVLATYLTGSLPIAIRYFRS